MSFYHLLHQRIELPWNQENQESLFLFVLLYQGMEDRWHIYPVSEVLLLTHIHAVEVPHKNRPQAYVSEDDMVLPSGLTAQLLCLLLLHM